MAGHARGVIELIEFFGEAVRATSPDLCDHRAQKNHAQDDELFRYAFDQHASPLVDFVIHLIALPLDL